MRLKICNDCVIYIFLLPLTTEVNNKSSKSIVLTLNREWICYCRFFLRVTNFVWVKETIFFIMDLGPGTLSVNFIAKTGRKKCIKKLECLSTRRIWGTEMHCNFVYLAHAVFLSRRPLKAVWAVQRMKISPYTWECPRCFNKSVCW